MKSTKNIAQITRFETPAESPGYLLWHLSLNWRGQIEEVLKQFNLTHPQFVILATTAWLTQDNEHISQIDISKTSGLDPNTTSQVLRSLEAKNFIQRVRTINEKNKNPQLTDLGHELLQKALPAVEKADLKFFSVLSEQEMVKCLHIFQKLSKKK